MRAWTIGAMAVLGTTLFGAITIGCDDPLNCTAIYIPAVVVTLVGADGVAIDSVTYTVDGSDERPCGGSLGEEDGGGTGTFSCGSGGGLHTIRVTSGTQTWTESVAVEQREDGCHPIQQELTVDVSVAP